MALLGYPIGGDSISVTAGVVSRIEVCIRPTKQIPSCACFGISCFRTLQFGSQTSFERAEHGEEIVKALDADLQAMCC